MWEEPLFWDVTPENKHEKLGRMRQEKGEPISRGVPLWVPGACPHGILALSQFRAGTFLPQSHHALVRVAHGWSLLRTLVQHPVQRRRSHRKQRGRSRWELRRGSVGHLSRASCHSSRRSSERAEVTRGGTQRLDSDVAHEGFVQPPDSFPTLPPAAPRAPPA